MDKTSLKIIRGGLSESFTSSRKIFLSAYITDTRLMGVVGMYIHWQLPDNPVLSDFHQFFYFDAEEFGLDTYCGILGNDDDELEETEHSLIGGLGGRKVEITQREAVFMVQHYVKFNRQNNLELPENLAEFDFLLEHDILLSRDELWVLMCKQCTPIVSRYEAINYFLMRCFGKDFIAADFLTTQNFSVDIFPELKESTLFMNTIDTTDDPDSFMCESLVEYSDVYHIVTTHIKMDGMNITGAEPVSTFRISSAEAAMKLTRPEYVSEYLLTCDPYDIDRYTSHFFHKGMLTEHENGRLYMIFHSHNYHVNKPVFRMNEDVFGIYYVSDSGEILIVCYDLGDMDILEKDLSSSAAGSSSVLIGKYEFKEPVLYDFIQSDFENFQQFVDSFGDEE